MMGVSAIETRTVR